MSEYEMGWQAGVAYAENLRFPNFLLAHLEEGVPYRAIRVHDEVTYERIEEQT